MIVFFVTFIDYFKNLKYPKMFSMIAFADCIA